MQYLVSVIDDTAGLATPDEMEAIDVYNDRLRAEGHWVFAGGLASPSTATVIDSRGEAPVFTDGPFLETKKHLAGFWIIEVGHLGVVPVRVTPLVRHRRLGPLPTEATGVEQAAEVVGMDPHPVLLVEPGDKLDGRPGPPPGVEQHLRVRAAITGARVRVCRSSRWAGVNSTRIMTGTVLTRYSTTYFPRHA